MLLNRGGKVKIKELEITKIPPYKRGDEDKRESDIPW